MLSKVHDIGVVRGARIFINKERAAGVAQYMYIVLLCVMDVILCTGMRQEFAVSFFGSDFLFRHLFDTIWSENRQNLNRCTRNKM